MSERMSQDDVRLLATFNSEKSRGIVHTDEWCERMTVLQARWQAEFYADRDEANEGKLRR